MSLVRSLVRALAVVSSVLTLVGCHKIFGDYTIDDSAFPSGVVLAPAQGLYTTEWGGQATFTIVLDHAPTANVTVALSSSNTNEGTVSPSSVIFTKDDWKARQVVTVTGVDDKLPDKSVRYKIITAPVVSDDKTFKDKNPIDLELLNVDDETAGITVLPRAGLVTSEMGGQDTFTVVLNKLPKNNVTIDLVSNAPTEGTVGPASLVFTPVNGMAPQLVTVTGVDDQIKDPAHKYQVTVSSTSDDPDYAALKPITVEAMNEDNESAGLSVALVTGIDPIDKTKLRTSEGGEMATFTVALRAPPNADVTIPVSSSVPSEGVVSPDLLLTFTQDNWNAPQTVMVTGVEDNGTADGDQPYSIVLGVPSSEDSDYAALQETEVLASNVDNETPGFTVKLVSGIDPNDSNQLQTTEAGTTATFTIALNSRPADTVTFDLSSTMIGEGTVTPGTLVFTPDNWQSPQTVSVIGVNDYIQDGSPVFYVRTGVAVSSDLGYVVDPPDVQVTNLDDDSAGVLVVLVKGIDPANPKRLVTDEYGSTATFSVALTSEPKQDVSISLSSSNPKEGVVPPRPLLFTNLNFRAPQEVTITGQQDDSVVDGSQPFFINVEAAQSEDANYAGQFASQVQVTNRDDDSPGVIVSPTSGLTTSEVGKSDSFTIRLQSKPTRDVSIAISSSNPAEGRANVTSVLFTPVNWNANQTIVVTGVDDDGAADGNAAYRIILDPAKSDDPNYNNKPDPTDVAVTNMDNESANIIVAPSSGLTTRENGLTASFTIVLGSKPVSSTPGQKPYVKIRLSSSRPLEGSVSPANVDFDDVNWNSAQTVTVTGKDDLVADGPQPYLINLSLAQSNDGNYNNRKPNDVSVTNTDDDSAGVQIMPVPSATPAITTEELGKSTFSVALNSLPTADVTFTLSSSNAMEGRVSPTTLTFTSANGKTAQVVTVTGVDNTVADGDQQYSVRLSNATSPGDPGYNGKFGLDLPFINIDDDHPGYDINAAPNLTTTENNQGSATFTVALKSQPMSNVSIGVSSSNKAEGTVSPNMLLFTPGTWSTPQTVTITGVQDDGVADGPQTYRVKLADASSPGDPNYDGKFATQLDVQNLDDDQVGYLVSADPLLQTTEGGGKATFSVRLKSKPADTTSVTLGLISSAATKEGSVSPSSLVFTSADWDQPHVVTVTGIDDKKVDGNVGYQITFTPDVDYGAPAPMAVALTNVDDDVLGVTVTPTTCATTPGTTATFTIRLNSQPSANVTISLTSDTVTQGTVSPDSVTFTSLGPGSWDTPQTVTVTGVDDMTTGMMTAYTIITGDASAPGETTGYSGYTNVADVACINSTP